MWKYIWDTSCVDTLSTALQNKHIDAPGKTDKNSVCDFNSGHDKACYFNFEIFSMRTLKFTFNYLSQNCCWLYSTSIVEFVHSHQNKCFVALPHKFSLSMNLSRSQKRGVFKFFSPFCGEKAFSSDMFPRLPKHFCEQDGTGNFLYSLWES